MYGNRAHLPSSWWSFIQLLLVLVLWLWPTSLLINPAGQNKSFFFFPFLVKSSEDTLVSSQGGASSSTSSSAYTTLLLDCKASGFRTVYRCWSFHSLCAQRPITNSFSRVRRKKFRSVLPFEKSLCKSVYVSRKTSENLLVSKSSKS